MEVNCTDINGLSLACSSINMNNSSDYIQSETLSDEEFEEEPCQSCVVALYPYDGEEEGTISMDKGEEFEVTSEDVDGWIKVKRINQSNEEGFVPFAYTQML